MPVLQDDDGMQQHQGASGFHFSAVNTNHLTASEYTIVEIDVDVSGSLRGFDQELESLLNQTVESLKSSPRADNLLLRTSVFSTKSREIHGYRLLADCNPALYAGKTATGGSTCLYDTTIDSLDSMAAYGKVLLSQDYTANGALFVITDGIDECSSFGVAQTKDAFERLLHGESVESLASVLIGVNVQEPAVARYLKKFKDEAGFAQYVEAKDARAKTLAKIAGFISRSVWSQSQKIGSGAASQPVNVTF